jgi:uncharacterized membrane protein YjjP (DUF1212 family)
VPAPAHATFGPIDDEEWAVSDRRYWLLVLLIPLFGVFFLGLSFGPVELAFWLVLAVTWLVAFINDDRLDTRVPLAVVGAVVVLGAGIAVYNHATVERPHVIEWEQR